MNEKLFKNNNKTYLHDLGTGMTTKEAINSNIGANMRHEMLLNVLIQLHHRKFIVREVNHVKLTFILPAIVIQQSQLLLLLHRVIQQL